MRTPNEIVQILLDDPWGDSIPSWEFIKAIQDEAYNQALKDADQSLQANAPITTDLYTLRRFVHIIRSLQKK